MKPGKVFRRLVLYPFLILWACATVLTGTPTPGWRLEKLNCPVAVKSIAPTGLVLFDGRTQTLPLVKRLPANDPLMLAAVKNGVEITEDGNVFGLLWVDRVCGLDPYVWDRRRVNLAILVAFLSPENLDEAQTPATVISEIQEYHRHFASDFRPRRYSEGRINGYDLQRMYGIESDLRNAARQQAEPQERLRWTFPAANAFGD